MSADGEQYQNVIAELDKEIAAQLRTISFIGSRKTGARYYARGLRHHWGIENTRHWQLDVTFREEENRVSGRNGGGTWRWCGG